MAQLPQQFPCELIEQIVLHNYYTVFSRLNTPSIYLKFGSFDPAFNRGPGFNRENMVIPFYSTDATTNSLLQQQITRNWLLQIKITI